jgi:hypothetical protein
VRDEFVRQLDDVQVGTTGFVFSQNLTDPGPKHRKDQARLQALLGREDDW